MLFLSGRHELAREAALAVLAEQPDDAEAMAMLARATWMLRRDDESVQCARRAVGLDPTNAFAMDSLARILLDAGRLDESLQVLNEALRIRPDDAGWMGLKAWVETSRGHHAAAIATARDGLRVEAHHTGCLASLAHAEFKRGNLEAARAACESMLRVEPESVFAHRLLGSIAIAARQGAEARARFVDALRIDPADENTRRGVVAALRTRSWWGRTLTALSASFVRRRWLWMLVTLIAIGRALKLGETPAGGVRDDSVFTLRSLVVLAVTTAWGLLLLAPGLALAPALLRRADRKFLSWSERAVAAFSFAPFPLMLIGLVAIFRVHEEPKYRVLAVAFLLLPAAAACAAARVPQRNQRRALLVGAGITALGALVAVAAAVWGSPIGLDLLTTAIVAAVVGPLLVAGMSRALSARRRSKP